MDAHLDRFPGNCGAYSNEHGELLHEEMLSIEERFKGKSVTRMLSEYCWLIRSDTNPHLYKKQNKKAKYF